MDSRFRGNDDYWASLANDVLFASPQSAALAVEEPIASHLL